MAKPKAAKKEKKEEKIKWDKVDHDKYRDLASKAVHYSFKTVNSNAQPGGIRLSFDNRLTLPYVCGRTLADIESMGVDYMGDAANAGVFKQISWVRDGFENCDIPADDAAFIRDEILPLMCGNAEFGTDFIGARMRQILLPKNGGYIATTPITAAGFAEQMNSAVRNHNEKVGEENEAAKNDKSFKRIYRRIRTGFSGVGGSNTQNVGRMIRELQSPLYFGSPTNNSELRKALSIHYKGIAIRISARLMSEYLTLRQSATSGMRERIEESGIFTRMAQSVLRDGEYAKDFLQQHVGVVGEDLVDESVDRLIAGLINPDLREKDWLRKFSDRVARAIVHHQRKDKGDVIDTLPGFGNDEQHEISRMIEKGVR